MHIKNELSPTPLCSDLLQLRKPCLHLRSVAANVGVSLSSFTLGIP